MNWWRTPEINSKVIDNEATDDSIGGDEADFMSFIGVVVSITGAGAVAAVGAAAGAAAGTTLTIGCCVFPSTGSGEAAVSARAGF